MCLTKNEVMVNCKLFANMNSESRYHLGSEIKTKNTLYRHCKKTCIKCGKRKLYEQKIVREYIPGYDPNTQT